MATQALSAITAVLKEVYEDRMVSQLQDEAVGFKRIKRTSDGVTSRAGGKFVDFPIMIQRNQGIFYRKEEEAFGPAGRSAYAEVHTKLKYGYGRMEVTGQLIDLADGNPQAFINAMDQEQTSLKDALAKDEARIFYGDGTGILAKVAANGTGVNTFAVDDVYWFETEMVVDILDMGSPATAPVSARKITAIDDVNNTITVDGATVTVVAGTHAVYRNGDYAGGDIREPYGLKAIVSNTGVLYDVDPASVTAWKSNVRDQGGALSEASMIRMMDDLRTKGSGGGPSLILTSLGARRAYYNLLAQQRTFSNAKTFEGGLVGLAFAYGGREIPFVEDPDLRPDYNIATATYTERMYFLNEKSFKIYQDSDWKWQDRGGAVLKWVVGYDKYEAFIQKYWELGVDRRNAHGVLTGITGG